MAATPVSAGTRAKDARATVSRVAGARATVAEHLLALADVTDRGLYHGDEFVSWQHHIALSRRRIPVLRELLNPSAPRHVGLLLDNVAEFSYLLGAAALDGVVIVGLNTTRRGTALAADIALSDCQVVLTCPSTAHLLDGIDLGSVPVIDVESARWSDLVSGASADTPSPESESSYTATPLAQRDDLLMLIFTSGTTGDPKAVMCTHRKFAANGAMLAERFEIGADDVVYLSMPMFHSNAMIAGWSVAVAGGSSIALCPRFSARGFVRDLHRYGVTYANYVGKPLHYILATETDDDDAHTRLRIMYGNEASAADRIAFAERFGCRVIDGFGSTEGGVAITRTPDTPDDALGPLREPTAIIDPESGKPLPPGQIGEIVNASGPGLFSGYYRDDASTAARMRGGVYHTGDLGWVDDAGYLHFAGRLGDWVRVDGENLGTAPIERILLRQPDIRQAAVFGVPVEIGDEIVAVLVADDLDAAGFAAFLAAQPDLGPKQWPHRVVITDSVPETATFKTVKRELRTLADDPTWVRSGTDYAAPTETPTAPAS